jgi:hypothetical protein
MNEIAAKSKHSFLAPNDGSPTKSFHGDSSSNVSPSADYDHDHDDSKDACRNENNNNSNNNNEFPEFDENDLVALDQWLDLKADNTKRDLFASNGLTTEQDEICKYEDGGEDDKDTLSDNGSPCLSKNDDGIDVDLSYVPKIPFIPSSNVDAFGFEVDPYDELIDPSLPKRHEQENLNVNEVDGCEDVVSFSGRNASQMETTNEERRSEIDPSFYEPRPREDLQDPIVHSFSTRNRPLHTRKLLPVCEVFDSTVSKLWQNKFDSFNQLQSEMANTLAYSDDNVIVSAPTGAGMTFTSNQ